MSELTEILKTIEELRERLQLLAKNRELTDPDVVAASQMLDAVLNEYQKQLKNKTAHS